MCTEYLWLGTTVLTILAYRVKVFGSVLRTVPTCFWRLEGAAGHTTSTITQMVLHSSSRTLPCAACHSSRALGALYLSTNLMIFHGYLNSHGPLFTARLHATLLLRHKP